MSEPDPDILAQEGITLPPIGPGPGVGPQESAIGGFVALENLNPVAFAGGPIAPALLPDRAPIYMEGDEFVELDGMAPELIWDLQSQLAALGIARGMLPGELDNATLNGFKSVLGMANRSNKRWRPLLDELIIAKDEGRFDGFGFAEERAPVALPARDPAELREYVRASMKQLLGRDPEDGELAELGAVLAGADAQASRNAMEFADEYAGAAPGEGVVKQEVNAEARLLEHMRQRYSGELEQIDRRDAAFNVRQSLLGSSATMDGLI